MDACGRTLRARITVVVLALAMGPAAALAVDGVIEINQARAEQGSVTVGDGAGFPVSIGSSGSYRLTSDLLVPADTAGLRLSADDVDIDLNGFTLASLGGTSGADGITLVNSQGRGNVAIRGGTVRGFPGDGLSFGTNTVGAVRVVDVRSVDNGSDGFALLGPVEGTNTVDRCTATGNGGSGFAVKGGIVTRSIAQGNTAAGFSILNGALLVDSVARGNGDVGVSGLAGAAFRSTVLSDNNGGDANAQVSGAINLGETLCGASLCP